MRSSLAVRLDRLRPSQRQPIAIAGSLVLHLCFFFLLMPQADGLASLGTTGVGIVDGTGTAVTLVDASELVHPKPSETPALTAQDEASTVEAAVVEDLSEPDDTAERTDAVKAEAELQKMPEMAKMRSHSRSPSESAADAAAGAHGQSGQANSDLWNAIAPCWNRIADGYTLSATLMIDFAPDGGLAVAPVIERDPDAAITDQSLRSEAKALAALSECGPYPMASNEANIAVVFPAPLNQ